MADQLYLSYWIPGFTEHNMLRHYERMLGLFPYSRLEKRISTFRIVAIDYAQPPLLERVLPPQEVLAAAAEFRHADSMYCLDTWWDVWQFDGDWEVAPSPASLCCFGPGFERDMDENLRIEFGIDSHFLPQPDAPNSPRMVQSNIKSLLKLVHDLDDALKADRRRLWTESGDNFAERLQEALEQHAD